MERSFQILLRNNPRASRFLAGALGLAVAAGLACLIWGWWSSRWIIAALGVAVGLTGAIGLARWQPWWRSVRVALESETVRVYLRRGRPWAIPLDVVECFFLGQAPSTMRDAAGQEVETRNVVIRLAERSAEWQQQPGVERSLGRWCDGYITVYGIWCEPLDRSVVEAMNHRLAELKRSRRAARGIPGSTSVAGPGSVSQ